MTKYLRILLFSSLLIGLAAGTAFAGGTLKVNQGAATTPFLIGLETLAGARNVSISRALNDGAGPNNVALSYTLGQSLAAASLLNITFSGAVFQGVDYSLCAQNTANNVVDNKIGGFLGTEGQAGINIAVDTSGANVAVAAGNFLALVGGTVCTADASNNLPVQIPITSSTGTATVTGYIKTGGDIYDSASAANVATILNQFAYGTPASSSNTIDYLTGAKNGSQFVGGVTSANTPNAINISRTQLNYGVADAGAGINVADLISLQDSQNWQGVRNVTISNDNSCTAGNNVAGANNFTGVTTLNLTIPAANVTNTTAAANANQTFGLCVDVTGNVALNQRAIKATPDLVVTGTGARDIVVGSLATIQTWTVNAFQAIVPYVSTTSLYKTICMIDNVDTAAAAAVFADIVSSTTGTTVAALSIGSVPAKTVMRVDFDVNVTPYTTGASETPEAAIPTGLTDPQRYVVKLTATSNPDNIHVNCIQLDPGGSKRAVPVLKQFTVTGDGGSGWMQ